MTSRTSHTSLSMTRRRHGRRTMRSVRVALGAASFALALTISACDDAPTVEDAIAHVRSSLSAEEATCSRDAEDAGATLVSSTAAGQIRITNWSCLRAAGKPSDVVQRHEFQWSVSDELAGDFVYNGMHFVDGSAEDIASVTTFLGIVVRPFLPLVETPGLTVTRSEIILLVTEVARDP